MLNQKNHSLLALYTVNRVVWVPNPMPNVNKTALKIQPPHSMSAQSQYFEFIISISIIADTKELLLIKPG